MLLPRYKKFSVFSLIWFSSISALSALSQLVRLSGIRVNFGHFRETEFFPEYPIINTEVGLSVPTSLVHYHYIRRTEKFTFSTYTDASTTMWDVLECFINEFLPEMDTYRESKLRAKGFKLVYRRRGRCLEFVRCSSFKTGRTTWRRDPYPFSLELGYSLSRQAVLKDVESYFRMFRLPVRLYRRIDRWWLAKKWWW